MAVNNVVEDFEWIVNRAAAVRRFDTLSPVFFDKLVRHMEDNRIPHKVHVVAGIELIEMGNCVYGRQFS